MLQDVGLRTGIRLRFMLEGAPLNLFFFYFLLAVQKFLNSLFPQQWMGQGGLRGLRRLFKSTNFYLCRYLNSVYLNGIHYQGANYPTKHNIQI